MLLCFHLTAGLHSLDLRLAPLLTIATLQPPAPPPNPAAAAGAAGAAAAAAGGAGGGGGAAAAAPAADAAAGGGAGGGGGDAARQLRPLVIGGPVIRLVTRQLTALTSLRLRGEVVGRGVVQGELVVMDREWLKPLRWLLVSLTCCLCAGSHCAECQFIRNTYTHNIKTRTPEQIWLSVNNNILHLAMLDHPCGF